MNDLSLVRSKLSHDLYRTYGIAAARTSYTRLYINNEYRGIYLNIEQIDEQMAAAYFNGQGDGNLYKCTYPADLNFISNNPDDYKFAIWGTRHYELKTNDYLDDYSDLSSFISTLNNTPSAVLSCELPFKFHVSEYLKIAAIDILLGIGTTTSFLRITFIAITTNSPIDFNSFRMISTIHWGSTGLASTGRRARYTTSRRPVKNALSTLDFCKTAVIARSSVNILTNSVRHTFIPTRSLS